MACCRPVLSPPPLCSVEFAVDTPTIAASSVCGGRRIVQVFPQGVRLLGEHCWCCWCCL